MYRYKIQILAITVLALGAVVAYSNSDVMHDNFDTFAELKSSQLIEKGWVPENLPKSSRNIEVTHNIDTNVVDVVVSMEETDKAIFIHQLQESGWQLADGKLLNNAKINIVLVDGKSRVTIKP